MTTTSAADAAFYADIFCDVNAAFSAACMAIAPVDAADAASRAAAAAASHSPGGGVHAIASTKQAAKLPHILREAAVTVTEHGIVSRIAARIFGTNGVFCFSAAFTQVSKNASSRRRVVNRESAYSFSRRFKLPSPSLWEIAEEES